MRLLPRQHKHADNVVASDPGYRPVNPCTWFLSCVGVSWDVAGGQIPDLQSCNIAEKKAHTGVHIRVLCTSQHYCKAWVPCWLLKNVLPNWDVDSSCCTWIASWIWRCNQVTAGSRRLSVRECATDAPNNATVTMKVHNNWAWCSANQESMHVDWTLQSYATPQPKTLAESSGTGDWP